MTKQRKKSGENILKISLEHITDIAIKQDILETRRGKQSAETGFYF